MEKSRYEWLCIFTPLVVVFFVIGGCAAPPKRLDTPSGNPEVTVDGVTKQEVIDVMLDSVLASGAKIESVNDHGIVVSKEAGGIGIVLVYGSGYDPKPDIRAHFYVVDTMDGVKIYAQGEIVTNPGSAYERKKDVTDSYNNDLQSALTKLKNKLTSKG